MRGWGKSFALVGFLVMRRSTTQKTRDIARFDDPKDAAREYVNKVAAPSRNGGRAPRDVSYRAAWVLPAEMRLIDVSDDDTRWSYTLFIAFDVFVSLGHGGWLHR
jgi:hypothetical protein